MHIYDNMAALYDKWFLSDPAYCASGPFYASVLSQMRGGNYLELGIGTGRISLEAIRSAPISVTGIDLSPQMLAVCRERYEALPEKKGTLCLREGDAARLTDREAFDGAIMPYHAVSHLLTEEALRSLFHGVFSALKPGGWFILDDFSLSRRNTPEWVNTDEPMVEYEDAEVTITDSFQCDFEKNLMRVEAFVNGERRISFVAHWHERAEMETHAKRAGFEVLSLMGNFDASPWTEQSPEQIWFLKKPGDALQLPQLHTK